jgi:hypothetical protein
MAKKEFVTFAKLITQKYSPEEAAKMTSIERHPEVYLTHLAERTKLIRMENPDKVRGLRIYGHDLKEHFESLGYSWVSKTGDELTGGKLTRFNTRMMKALEQNIAVNDGIDAHEAFTLVNGQGSPNDANYIRKMFVKVDEIVQIVDADGWGAFRKKLGMK